MEAGAELEKFLGLLGRRPLVLPTIITSPPPLHILLPYFLGGTSRPGHRTLGLGRAVVIEAKGGGSSFLPAWAGGPPHPHLPPSSDGCALHPLCHLPSPSGPSPPFLPPCPSWVSSPILFSPFLPRPLPWAHSGERSFVAPSPRTPLILVLTGTRAMQFLNGDHAQSPAPLLGSVFSFLAPCPCLSLSVPFLVSLCVCLSGSVSKSLPPLSPWKLILTLTLSK